MPTVLVIGRYRFYFYSRENGEPPHIHVESGDQLAKYWLEPVKLASSKRIRDHELTVLGKLVIENREAFLKAWHDHLNSEE
jgi:hypothetical protein